MRDVLTVSGVGVVESNVSLIWLILATIIFFTIPPVVFEN
jgi:hypothetical protein